MTERNIVNRKPKPLQELNLTSRFLFNEVVEDKSIQQDILSIVLEKDISLLSKHETEKELRAFPGLRSVRLDVYSMDEEKTVYNTEMQGTRKEDLPRRSRYYQGLMDCGLLSSGVLTYNLLNDTCIIIITTFDPFGLGKYRYTFHGWCDEDKDCIIRDGATRIFLNTKGINPKNVSCELVEFLRYVEDSSERTAAGLTSERVRRIHDRVQEIKRKTNY